jgi:EAL domain-containing protein (putative c-di-GMP-specific phosphodiesterase class I)
MRGALSLAAHRGKSLQSQNAMAVRPPTAGPAASAASDPATAESLGWQLRAALPPLRLHSVSLYDKDANVLWLSEGALGPDEHGLVLEAMEALATDTTQTVHENGMEDGRVAICLPVRTPKGDIVGLSMILADIKSVGDGVLERLTSPQIRTIVQKIAVLLRGSVSKTGETGVVPVLDVTSESSLALMPDTARHVVPPAAPPTPAAATAAGKKATPPARAPIAAVPAAKAVAAPAKSSKGTASPTSAKAATGEPLLSSEAIDDILEFELTPNLPAVEIAKSAPSRDGAAGLAAKRVNGAAPAVAASSATNGAVDLEVTGSDVGQITTPNVVNLSPAVDVSDVDLTAGPEAAGGNVPTLSAAGAQIPTLGAASNAAPALQTTAPGPAVSVSPTSTAASAGATTAPVAAAVTAAASAPATPAPAAPSTPAATTATAPATARSSGSGATTSSRALPSTGATTSSRALPSTGATTTLRVLSSSDAQLLLEVQPYAKLRAGGRSRRFELQVRTPNNRDASRDSAALDAHALQRLLSWLSINRGSWNLEPTSFTLNLSITTLEDERFPQNVASALKNHGISPETIGFEIAEALCMQRRAQVERFINLCDKIGCFIVIDDFSMDSSVLPLLRSKALRLVKIDPKLTGVALKDKLAQALVVAIAQAVRVLGIHCSAKRVETQGSLQWLTAIGCDFAQGSAVCQLQPLEALLSAAPELAKA